MPPASTGGIYYLKFSIRYKSLSLLALIKASFEHQLPALQVLRLLKAEF